MQTYMKVKETKRKSFISAFFLVLNTCILYLRCKTFICLWKEG